MVIKMLKLFLPLISLLFFMNNNYFWLMSSLIMMLMILNFIFNYMVWGLMSTKLSEWIMLDSISFLLLMFTIWIMVIMFICSMKYFYLRTNHTLFGVVVLLLLLTLLISFSQSNILCFYILFEFSLIPTMWLIMKWGYQPERLQASLYLMMYTVMGSLPMLCCLMYMMFYSSNFSFFMWFMNMDMEFMNMWWLLFLLGFLVKLPLYPFHLWLPKAHVEAPVAGSVILASILLKLGGYGVMRMGYLYPWLNLNLLPSLMSLSLIGGVITSLICLRQIDLKSLIAYSSVGHMGLLLIGSLSSCKMGMMGGMLMMVAHGFSSSALFILANINYESCNSRSLMVSKGVLLIIPMISFFWFIFSVMNMAAPPFINLFSEIFIIMSILSISIFSLLPFIVISFLALCYSLNMYSMINHGMWSNYLYSYKLSFMKDYMLLIYMLVPSLLLIFKLDLFIM
uniref:NADH-ubiquinone oxidoreductase chain 4 n=1 Tax=Haemopis sanguisuga TaxID=51991 RepID=A0A7L7S0E1_9ANNE|nr:NADH dehydrogenase subunit 4 [Haemopis sanguisuga]